MPEPMSEERLQEVLKTLDGMADETYEDQAAGFLYDVREELARSRSEESNLRATLSAYREETALMSAMIQGLDERIKDLRIALQGADAFRRASWREALKNGANIDSLAQALMLAAMSPAGRRDLLIEAEAEGRTVLQMAPEAVRKAWRKAARSLARDGAREG